MKNKQINNISFKTAIQEMQKNLEMYKKDKNSVKEFYPCTQKLTKDLEAKKR